MYIDTSISCLAYSYCYCSIHKSIERRQSTAESVLCTVANHDVRHAQYVWLSLNSRHRLDTVNSNMSRDQCVVVHDARDINTSPCRPPQRSHTVSRDPSVDVSHYVFNRPLYLAVGYLPPTSQPNNQLDVTTQLKSIRTTHRVTRP